MTSYASPFVKIVVRLQLRQKHHVNLVLLRRGQRGDAKKKEKSSTIDVPMSSTVIFEDDILMVAGSDMDLAKFPQE